MHFSFDAGIAARVEEPIAPAALDSEEDRSMDPDDARDYEDQFPCLGVPARTGSINDENLEILAAILKNIPECMNEEDFGRLSDLLPHIEPVHVPTRTVQEAIAVSY
jgi:hypothetical protein